eukprot:Selendium_serpulae@DN4756_c0_g1_i1.p2
MGIIHCVSNDQVYIVENCGKFDRAAQPGLLVTPIPCWCRVSGKVSKRIVELNVDVETKTLDNVFVHINISVQYAVISNKIYEAYYMLEEPENQIRSYVFDVVRSTVPTQNLDTVFESKDDIALAVKSELTTKMETYGYLIVQTLVTDISPDSRVKSAMNAINASKRDRLAAQEKAEADKLLTVKRAEADAEAKYLQGEGLARQRKAIIDGLQESVTDFQSVKGLDSKEVLDLVLITQYFDTLKELGEHSKGQTLFVPHNPGALATLAEEIRGGIVSSQHPSSSSNSNSSPSNVRAHGPRK